MGVQHVLVVMGHIQLGLGLGGAKFLLYRSCEKIFYFIFVLYRGAHFPVLMIKN